MIYDKIMHILQVKKIPEQLMEWIRAFMIDRTSILVLSNIKIKEKPISAGVLQESPLSPILYLFYAAELLEAYNSIIDWLSTSIFIDDTTLLAYGQTIKGNYWILESAHNHCMNWA